MNRIQKLLESSIEQIAKDNFTNRINKLGYEGIIVGEPKYNPSWDIITFPISDDQENYIELVIAFDDDNTPFCMPIPDESVNFDTEKQEVMIDLSSVIPGSAKRLEDIIDFKWISASVLRAMLVPGKVGVDESRIMMGKSRMRLPFIREVHRRKMSPKMLYALSHKINNCAKKDLVFRKKYI